MKLEFVRDEGVIDLALKPGRGEGKGHSRVEGCGRGLQTLTLFTTKFVYLARLNFIIFFYDPDSFRFVSYTELR